jgi:hypothetical protein
VVAVFDRIRVLLRADCHVRAASSLCHCEPMERTRMSRSGYTEDYGEEFNNQLEFYRKAVDRAIWGKRGQVFLKDMLAALDALPNKRLVQYEFETEEGDVCALGSVARVKGVEVPKGDFGDDDGMSINAHALGRKLNIAECLVREIMFENDELGSYYAGRDETPEDRFIRMRAWVASHIKGETA